MTNLVSRSSARFTQVYDVLPQLDTELKNWYGAFSARIGLGKAIHIIRHLSVLIDFMCSYTRKTGEVRAFLGYQRQAQASSLNAFGRK